MAKWKTATLAQMTSSRRAHPDMKGLSSLRKPELCYLAKEIGAKVNPKDPVGTLRDKLYAVSSSSEVRGKCNSVKRFIESGGVIPKDAAVDTKYGTQGLRAPQKPIMCSRSSRRS